MSHGGFGGGHGHSGFGHGGHHAGHVGHGISLGHGLGLGGGGHHGTIIGHVLRALGIGNHGQHHGVGAGHHPDQGPGWNQAMQGEKRPGYLLRVDKRPFAVLFLLVFSSFAWLWIVYNVHHAESSKGNGIDMRAPSGVEAVQPAAPAGSGIGSYANTQQYAQAQSQAMQNYAAQYMSAATANGAAQMYGMAGTGYGGAMAPNAFISGASPYVPNMPAGGYGGYGAAGAPAPVYGVPGAFSGRPSATMGYYPYGPVQTGYAPTANGRARLVVAR